MSEIETEFLFEMHAQLNPPIDCGAGPNGHRLVIITPGGKFQGPRLKGEVVANSGGDWARLRSDGSFALDVRVNLKTDDGAVIYMVYGGRLVAPDPATMEAALNFGTPEDGSKGSKYYFRTNPIFETGSEKYSWLNGIVAVGKGWTGGGGVTYRVFKVN